MFDNSKFFGAGSTPFFEHTIDGSMYLDGYNGAYALRTAIDVDDEKKGTWSWWWKRAGEDIPAGSSTVGQFFLHNVSNSTNRGLTLGTGRTTLPEGLYFGVNPPSSATANRTFLATNAQFHDQSAWVHVLWIFDSTDAEETERCKCYVNGVRQTSFFEEDYPPLNAPHYFDTGHGQWEFGDVAYGGVSAQRVRFRGYMTEFHFMDGQTYGPEYFGEFKNGTWIPKEVTGVTYGTGGFYMPFTSDTNDASGNGNHFTASGIGSHDFKKDSPTNNFCVINPLTKKAGGGSTRVREGNLEFLGIGGNDSAFGSMAVSSGKWYYEIEIVANPTNLVAGWTTTDETNTFTTAALSYYKAAAIRNGTKTVVWNADVTTGLTFANGDIIGFALDIDGGDLKVYQNNSLVSTITLPTDKGTEWIPAFGDSSSTDAHFVVNFGQESSFAGNTTSGSANAADGSGKGDFYYTPPSGYLALCADNLPDPSIDPNQEEEPHDYFDTFLYTGNGGALQVGDVTKKPADTTTISNSLRFNDDDSPYLSRTVPSDGAGNQDTFTISCWVKRSNTNTESYLFSAANTNASTEIFYVQLRSDSFSNILNIVWRDNASTPTYTLTTNRQFTNSTTWDHFVIAVDTTQSTATDRIKVYINGVLESNFSSDSRSSLSSSSSLAVNAASTLHTIGTYSGTLTGYLDGYLAEYHFVDGTAYDATYFGNFDANGIWIPKAVSGLTYGTNGFHLDFSSTTPATQSLSFTENWSDVSNWSGSGSGSTSVSNGTVSFAPTSSSSWNGRTLTHTLSADYQDFDITFNDWTITEVSNDLIRYQIWLKDSSNNTVAGYYYQDSHVHTTSGTEDSLYVYNGSNNIQDVLLEVGTAARTYTLGPADFRIARTGRVVTFDMPGFTNISALSANMNPVDKIVLTVERLSGYSYSPNSLGTISATGSPVITTIDDQVGSNDWTLNNMNFADSQTTDSPTNNHAVFNSDSGNTFTDGSLSTTTGTSSNRRAVGTLGMRTGKHYWEVTVGSSVSYGPAIGIHSKAIPVTTNSFVLNDGDPSAGYYKDGNKYVNGTASSYGSAMQAYDTVGVAYDADAKTLEFYLNNVSQGSFGVGSEISDVAYPVVGDGSGSYGVTVSINFGQLGFAYTPPTGYTALSENNLSVDENNIESPDLVWIKDRDYTYSHVLVDSVRGAGKKLYANTTSQEADDPNSVLDFNKNGFTVGNNVGVNNLGDDFVAWCWKSSGTAQSATYAVKVVSDSGNKYRFDDFGSSAVTLELSEGGTYTFDQSDSSNSGHPLRFSTTSDGSHGGGSEYTTGVTTNGTPGSAGAYTKITVASGAPTLYYYCSNHSGMGGQANTPTTKGYSNFKGTIQSKVLTNTESGFSIVNWTGNATTNATVGHGLSASLKPRMVIIRPTNDSTYGNWQVQLASEVTGAERYLRLNLNDVSYTLASYMTNVGDELLTFPGTTTATRQYNNVSNKDYIAYCFADVEGYLKIGTYEGNNVNGDNSFIYTGFRPAWVMIKNIDASGSWGIWDVKRNPHNVSSTVQYADQAVADNTTASTNDIFIVSNGFKVEGSAGFTGDAVTYLYMAIAEQPLKYANAR